MAVNVKPDEILHAGDWNAALREPLLAAHPPCRHPHPRSSSHHDQLSDGHLHDQVVLAEESSKPPVLGFAGSRPNQNFGSKQPQQLGIWGASCCGNRLETGKAEHVVRRVSLRLVAVCCLIVFLCYVDRTNFGIAAEQLLGDLGFEESTYARGVSAFFVGYVVLQIPSALLLERLGAPLWMGVSLVVWGLAAMGTGFVQTPLQLYVVRFMLGVAESGTFPGVWYYLGLFIPEDRVTFAIAAVDVTLVMSQVAAAPMAAGVMGLNGMAGLWGWQWLFISEGLPTMLLGLFFWFRMPKGLSDANFLTPVEKEWLQNEITRVREEKGQEDGKQGFYSQVIGAVWNMGLWAASFIYLLRLMSMYVILFWSVLLIGSMRHGHGLQPCSIDDTCGQNGDTSTVLLATVPYSVAAIATIFNGWHSQKTNERKLHAAFPFMFGASVLALVPLLTTINFYLAFFALTVGAMGAVSGGSPVTALASAQLGPSSKAFGLALYNSFANLGGVIGPLVTGTLVHMSNSYAPPILTMAAVLFIAGTLVGLLHDPLRAKRAPTLSCAVQVEHAGEDEYIV